MGLFENFPYSNFQQMNLDWLLRKIKEMGNVVDNITDTINDAVNSALKEMAADGTLAELIKQNAWYTDKKIVAYGDSSGTASNNFIDILTDIFKLNITNRCIGGTTLSQLRTGINPDYENNSGYQMIQQATDLSSFDYCLIIYGINDWQTYQPITSNDFEDVNTYEYCASEIIRMINTKAPNCVPVFIFPWFCYHTNFSLGTIAPNGCSLEAYINKGIEICEKNNIPYINMYTLTGVNATNYATFLRNDSPAYVHANALLGLEAAWIFLQNMQCTGRCHGNNWSDNLVSAYPGNIAVYPAEHDNTGGKLTVYPARKFSNAGNCMQIKTVSDNDRVLVRFKGYAHQPFSVTFYTSKNKSITQSRAIPVSAGYFDMYVDLPNGEYVTPAVKANTEGGVLLWGLGFYVQGASGARGMSQLITFSGGNNLTWKSTGSYYCADNMIHFPSAIAITKQEIAAGTALLGGLFPDLMQKEVAFRTGNDIGIIAAVHHTIYTQTALPSARQIVFPGFSVPLDMYSPISIS